MSAKFVQSLVIGFGSEFSIIRREQQNKTEEMNNRI